MTEPFRVPALAPYCYVRGAETDDGRAGFCLFDSNGDIELFAESEEMIFAYIEECELTFLSRH